MRKVSEQRVQQPITIYRKLKADINNLNNEHASSVKPQEVSSEIIECIKDLK